MEFKFFAGANPRTVDKGANEHRETTAEVFKHQAEFIELAEHYGFASVGFTEHHFNRTGFSVAPLISAVEAASRTKRLRVSTDVILTAYHHPLILAEQIALTDILTGGRLDCGFGKGSSGFEAMRVGLSGIKEAGERQNEALEILLGVWAKEEEFSYEGRYYKILPTMPMPRPVQQPHPPMWVAARSTESMRFCILHGLGILTTAQSEAMSHVYDQLQVLDALVEDLGAPGRPHLGATRPVFIAQDKVEIRTYLEQAADTERKIRTTGFNDSTIRERVSLGLLKFDSAAVERTGEDAYTPEVIAERYVVGTPDVVIHKLREYEALGFDEFAVGFGGTYEQALRGMHLFGEYVIPEFRDRPIAPKVRSLSYAPLGGSLNEADPAREAAIAEAYGLAPDWRWWWTDEWVAHVDRAAAAGDPRHVYVFDFAFEPKVRGDVSGYIDPAGKLQRVFGESCPTCGRPVVALYNRRNDEGSLVMKREVQRLLREGDWHAGGRHLSVYTPEGAGAGR